MVVSSFEYIKMNIGKKKKQENLCEKFVAKPLVGHCPVSCILMYSKFYMTQKTLSN